MAKDIMTSGIEMTKDIMTSGIEMADVIKPTGFPVPEDMEGKTFVEVVEGGGSGDITVEALTATENKVYTAPEGKAYSPVTVNVPSGGSVTVEPLNVTENGTYTAPSGKAYSPVTVNVPSGGSWHNINDPTMPIVGDIIRSSDEVVAFDMLVSNGYVKGAIMGGEGDGGTIVSACGMKVVDYWDRPSDCFFDTGFDIGYASELTWNAIATAILNAYNTSTGGSETFMSFEIYY